MLERSVRLVKRDMYKAVTTFVEDPIVGSKANKTEAISNTTVEYNGMVFDADEQSIERMSRYIQIATFDYNKAVVLGDPVATAFEATFTNSTVNWKLANNTTVEISIEDLVEVYKLTVSNMQQLWLA